MKKVLTSKKRKVMALAALGMVIVLASSMASGTAFAAKSNNYKSTSVSSTQIISKTKAEEIALAKTGGGTVTKCKLDYDDGVRVYEIEIINGNKEYSMDVDAYTGAISDYEVETIKTSSNTNTGTSSITITVDKAKEIALAKTGGGTVIKCKLDYDDGVMVYDIEIINGNKEYSMDVDAYSGIISDYEVETIRNSSNTNTSTPAVSESTTITADKAKEIALAKTGGGTVTKCELDYDNVIFVYEIEIVNGSIEYDIDINASTAEIVKYEQENIGNNNTSTNNNTSNNNNANNNSGNNNTTSNSNGNASSEITAAKAQEIALAKSGGGTVVECKLDYEDGVKVYEIEIINGNMEHSMDIDAITGAIYDYEVEIDD